MELKGGGANEKEHQWGWGHFRGEGISRVNNVAEKQGSFQDSPLGAIKPPPPEGV